jgi:Domain of unknown function (DUF4873)
VSEAEQGDGYLGPATLAVNGASFTVQVELRGHFEPIDGRYHWYGRIGKHEDLLRMLGTACTEGTLTTSRDSAPCQLSDPDPWGRYRVTGISTPPYAVDLAVPPPEDQARHVTPSAPGSPGSRPGRAWRLRPGGGGAAITVRGRGRRGTWRSGV